jgi:predicted dehydrogenase
MNVGIIGYGYTGQQHARAIAAIQGVTLKAIAEPDEKNGHSPMFTHSSTITLS